MVTALAAITLACLVHPGLGLLVLLLSHALCCHTALCSFISQPCSHARRHELFDYKKDGNGGPDKLTFKRDGDHDYPTFVSLFQIILMSGISKNALEELSSERSSDDRIPLIYAISLGLPSLKTPLIHDNWWSMEFH
ncbi:uncharacterized protein LOC133723437 [Rosa rugosa]|uniref:uncharacterized protein LOC133723437 n=1 Tax=Rosa rugosa TaxID=74645 RepID=UPI002B40C5FC|nr:uncharacterized protein LOC133723437 [Rosa rugosa]